MAASAKKRKYDSDDKNIFRLFHSNAELLCQLKNDINYLEHRRSGRSGYGLCLSKIKTCDAICKQHFSNATCKTNYYMKEEGSTQGYAISSVFEYGFDVIESYIEAPYRFPLREGAKIALSKLLTFLSKEIGDVEKRLAEVSVNVTEGEWAVMLVHHLLSKLAVSPGYVLDKQHRGNQQALLCTCGCKEKITGTYGDTSFGVPTGWHGGVDILMDVAVKIPLEDLELLDNQEIQFHVEVQPSGGIMENIREQARAQSIVFSFLQLKNHPEYKNHLIPTIAVSKKQVVCFFYDSKNDILLETPPMNLVLWNKLDTPTVLVLWLVLNFRYFCSGIPDEIKNIGFTADFFKHVGSSISSYETEVVCPCDVPLGDEDRLVLPEIDIIRRGKPENINRINNDPDIF